MSEIIVNHSLLRNIPSEPYLFSLNEIFSHCIERSLISTGDQDIVPGGVRILGVPGDVRILYISKVVRMFGVLGEVEKTW